MWPATAGSRKVRANGSKKLERIEQRAIHALEEDARKLEQIRTRGLAGGALKGFFLDILPPDLDNRDNFAYSLVPKALNQLFGAQDEGRHSYKHPERRTAYVKAGRKEDEEPV